MKKKILGIFVCMLMIGSIFGTMNIVNAYFGEVLDSFPCPGPSGCPEGLAWDGSYLWNADSCRDKIYKFDTSGTDEGSFDTPACTERGLTWDGTYLYLVSSSPNKIYKLTTSGTLEYTYNSPVSSPYGLTWDGTNFWLVDDYYNRIYKLTTSFTVITYFDTPGSKPRGLTWDGTYLWNADESLDKIYKLTTSGSIENSFNTPETSPRGLTWDGAYLWFAAAKDGTIYKIDVAEDQVNPPEVQTLDETNVEATSARLWGKILDDGGEGCEIRFEIKEDGGSPWYVSGWHGSFNTDDTFSEIVNGLDPYTDYLFRAGAQNSGGDTWDDTWKDFTTDPNPPEVQTLDADNIGRTSARLKGKIIDDGGKNCQIRFQIREVDGDWWYVCDWHDSFQTDETFFHEINYLDSGKTYEFKAGAKNSADNIVWGSVEQFTTTFHFVHITDPHVRGTSYNPDERWEDVISQINSWDPAPEFVLCSGDLVDIAFIGIPPFDEPVNYDALTNPLHKANNMFYIDSSCTIPIYFCPGNHDSMSWYLLPPYSFDSYYAKIGNYIDPDSPDYYSLKHENCAIFSMNSGMNTWEYNVGNWWNPFEWAYDMLRPEGDGLSNTKYSNEVDKMLADLDDLDGIQNGQDDSSYFKIIITHHPYIHSPDYKEMVFWWNRNTFVEACEDYDVDIHFSGHLHWNSDVNKMGYTWSSSDGTRFIQTESLAEDLAYRNITVSPSALLDVSPTDYFGDTITVGGGCNALGHSYDSEGNHDGPNETGGIEMEIPYSTYLQERAVNESMGWNATHTDISVYRKNDENYSFIFESLKNDNMSFTIKVNLKQGFRSIATYENITMYEGSNATIYANYSIADYIIKIKDPGGSREIEPTSYEGNLPPEKPKAPLGPTEIKKDVEYTFNASTIDPDWNDSLYYQFDWGDGDDSGWIGPFESGEICNATHIWTGQNDYEIKVRAKDVAGCITEWSDSLPITVPHGCVERTQINMAYGSSPSVKNIEDIIVGDYVSSYDLELQVVVPAEVIAVYNYTELLLDINYSFEGNIGVTSNLFLFINGTEWMEANDTGVGYYVLENTPGTNDTSLKTITSINELCILSVIYDLEIKPLESGNISGYFADGILVGYTPEIPPEITNVSAYPDMVGFGFNVTISADVTDNVMNGVDIVKVNITYPDSSTGNFTMYSAEINNYKYVFSDTWLVGQYNYTIWAVDNASNTNSSSGHSFNVSHYFGYTELGVSHQTVADRITGSVFTVNEYGIADNITRVHPDLEPISYPPGDPKMKCMIFRANDSKLIGTTEESASVFNFLDPKPELVKDTKYILTVWGDNSNANFYYDDVEDERGRYFNLTYNSTLPDPLVFINESRLYSVYCSYTPDATPPEITNVSNTPDTVGFGFNVTISADVTDDLSGVDIVKVNITYPNSTTGNFTMDNAGSNTYEYIFSDTWLVGQYNYTIWVVDKSNNINTSSQYSFNVSAQCDILIETLKDDYGSNEYVNITDPPEGCVGGDNEEPQIGYELLDDNTVLHIWNGHNDYYFNTSSGIQLTNYYNEYWSHNVLMLGYYNNDEWNLLYRTDQLTGFNKNIDTDNETYVDATLWKDLSYSGYDFRLAIRYHLKVDDYDLTIIPYIENLGQAIPYDLAFGWEINDIKIANTAKDNYLQIYNGTGFEKIQLNQMLDRNFTDMDLNTTINLICTNPPTKHLSRNLYLSWDKNLTYKVTVKSRPNQYNAPVTLFIKIGMLGEAQSKSTELHWLDSDDWLGVGYTVGEPIILDGCSDPGIALYGFGVWSCEESHTHYFVLYLRETYLIKNVRGRSNTAGDPVNVSIYVCEDTNPIEDDPEYYPDPDYMNWGDPVATGIDTWRNTTDWVEIETVWKNGNYIKVEVTGTEGDTLMWGDNPPFTIFDIYGDMTYPDKWLGLNSDHPIDACCGLEGLKDAFDGECTWCSGEVHEPEYEHWFILDFGTTYTIGKVRGRSDSDENDPADVDIYISDNQEDWGEPVATGIDVWQDTKDWVDVYITRKPGRYMKVVAHDVGEGFRLCWGASGDGPWGPDYLTIFGVYGHKTTPGDWFEVNNSNIDSCCSEIDLEEGHWECELMYIHTHHFILDLGKTYRVSRAHGRSEFDRDPTDVDIYISDNLEDWGNPVAEGINTWKNTSDWVEIYTRCKVGRYVKVVVNSTEEVLVWHAEGPIFDVYVDDVNMPTISNPYPDGDTSVSLSPTLSVTINDADGDLMNITWYTNASGTWTAFRYDDRFVGNDTFYHTFTDASTYREWWYWKVKVNDGTMLNESSVYKFFTGNQSKIKNTGSTDIKGYLLMQIQYYNETLQQWVVADDTVNETNPRTINASEQLGLDTVFNGLVNTNDLSYGNGIYRVYAAFRDQEGNVLVNDDETEMVAWYEFEVDTS